MEQPFLLFSQKWVNILIVLLFSQGIVAQHQVTVHVIDDNNQPLLYAHIANLNTNQLFAADSTGKALISYQSHSDTLKVSYIGYNTVSLTVEDIMQDNNIIRLSPILFEQEIMVIGRMGLQQNELPYEVVNISAKSIQSIPSSNTADIIQQSAGVFIQKSQGGGGSPILRGFEANKLLLIVDGTKLNNSIYRSGHQHNALSIDPASLERIELILGPNALLYGSDALGGVIHFKTKSPVFKEGRRTLALNLSSKLTSATGERSVHIDGSWTAGKHGFLTGFSYLSFGDILAGKNPLPHYPGFGKRKVYVQHIDGKDSVITNPNPYLQVGTGYKQWHFLQKWTYLINNENQLTTNLQYTSGTDIQRYDQLTRFKNGKPKWATWRYGPLSRTLASVTLDNYNHSRFSDKFKIITSYQHIEEERIKRKLYKPKESHNLEQLDIFSLTLDFQKDFDLFHESEWSYGADLQSEYLHSEAFSTNIYTGVVQHDVITRYPDGENRALTGGLYGLLNTSILPDWKLQMGGRWSFNQINIQYVDRSLIMWPKNYYSGLSNFNQALTGSAGVNWAASPTLLLRLLIGTAFRTPNIDDIAKIRIKNGEVLIPNPTLKPERTTNIETSINKSFEPRTGIIFHTGLTGFYTRLNDAIVRRPAALPDGASSLQIDGDEYITVTNVNTSKGTIKGISAVIDAQLGKFLSFKSTNTYLIGTALDSSGNTAPLAHIPPPYGYFKVKYKYPLPKKSNYWWVTYLNIHYNGPKPLDTYSPSSTDNLQYATPEGTPAWQRIDLGIELHRNKGGMIQMGVNNILDKHYRPFASGVSAPGRNFFLGFTWKFQKSY